MSHQLGLDTANPDTYLPPSGPPDPLYKLPLEELCSRAAKQAVESGRVDGLEGSSLQHLIRVYDTASRARGEAR